MSDFTQGCFAGASFLETEETICAASLSDAAHKIELSYQQLSGYLPTHNWQAVIFAEQLLQDSSIVTAFCSLDHFNLVFDNLTSFSTADWESIFEFDRIGSKEQHPFWGSTLVTSWLQMGARLAGAYFDGTYNLIDEGKQLYMEADYREAGKNFCKVISMGLDSYL